MKKISTILAAFALVFVSCEKEETVEEGPNYDTIEMTVSYNSENGEGDYPAQTFVNLETPEDAFGYNNSQSEYTSFVVVYNPENTTPPVTTAPGDWYISITKYAVDLEMGPGSWYDGYQVPGVIINSDKNVSVHRMYDDAGENTDYITFEDITLADASDLEFNSNIDAIGYNWKKTDISVTPPVTAMVDNNFYIVKVSDTEIYKLKFNDYYANDPITGVPTKGVVEFQYQLLK